MTKQENLSVDLIELKLGTQMRAQVNDDTVEQYADLWKAKHEFPPIDVFHDGERFILADGFHRLYGAKAAKRASVPCRIHKGGLREAILFACGANHDHGLHRSNADKQIAIDKLLDDPEWCKRSARWIAEQCRVSDKTVSKRIVDRKPSVLNDSTAEIRSSKVESKDGKARPSKPKKCLSQSDMPQEPDDVPEEKTTQISGGATFDPVEIETVTANQSELFAAKVRQQNSAIESFARSLMAAFDNPPSDPWLDDSRLNIARDQIRSACSTIRLAKAHDKQCPKCDGAGSVTGKPCRACRGCGYLPKSSYEAMGAQ